MQEADAVTVEEDLRALLAELGLQWVLDQIDEFVLEGKPEFKRFRGARGDETEAFVRELTTKRGVPRSEPYTASERLSILLEALQRIATQPVDLETDISASVVADEALDDVVWVDELEREPTRRARDAQQRDKAARDAYAELQPVLEQLIDRTHE